MVAGLVGSLASSALSSVIGSAMSSRDYDNWITSHPIEATIWNSNLSREQQQSLMATQYQYNSALANQQFQLNKYFTEHGHQAEVSDLRKAGLNPVLSANNGAYSQVGLGSVGLGSATVPDVMQGTSAMSNAKTQKSLAKMKAVDILSDIMVKRSSSALQYAQADVEHARVHNVNMDTELKSSQIALNNIEQQIGELDKKIKSKDYNSYDVRLRNELQKTKIQMIQAQASLIGANAQKTSAHSNALYNARRPSGAGYSKTLKLPFGLGSFTDSSQY